MIWWLVYGVLHCFQQYFSYLVEVSFIGGGKLEYPEKNTDLSQLTNYIIWYDGWFMVFYTAFNNISVIS